MAAEVFGSGVDGGTTAGGSGRVLRGFVAAVLATATGPQLLSRLVELTGRGDLSARECLEVSAGWKAMIGFCTAGQLTAVGDLDRALNPDPSVSDGSGPGSPEAPAAVGGPGRSCPVRVTADELAPVLGIAPRAASALVGLVRRVEDLPAVVDALAEGRMDLTQVKITDQVVRDLSPAAVRVVEAAAVAWAPRRTAQRLRADLAAEAMRVDPEHATTAVARGVVERDVSCRPSPVPGCRRIVADLPLVGAHAAWLGLNGAAKNAKEVGVRPDGTPEDRSLGQLRADTFNALLTGQADEHGLRIRPRSSSHGWPRCRWWWPPTPSPAPATCPPTSPVSAPSTWAPSATWLDVPGGGAWSPTLTPAPSPMSTTTSCTRRRIGRPEPTTAGRRIPRPRAAAGPSRGRWPRTRGSRSCSPAR